jgi:hypothetical protein
LAVLKKKYKFIISDYKNDKRANEILGADRHQECRWSIEMVYKIREVSY